MALWNGGPGGLAWGLGCEIGGAVEANGPAPTPGGDRRKPNEEDGRLHLWSGAPDLTHLCLLAVLACYPLPPDYSATTISTSPPSAPIIARNVRLSVVPTCVGPDEGGRRYLRTRRRLLCAAKRVGTGPLWLHAARITTLGDASLSTLLVCSSSHAGTKGKGLPRKH